MARRLSSALICRSTGYCTIVAPVRVHRCVACARAFRAAPVLLADSRPGHSLTVVPRPDTDGAGDNGGHGGRPALGRIGVVQVFQTRLVEAEADEDVHVASDERLSLLLADKAFLQGVAREPVRLFVSKATAARLVGNLPLDPMLSSGTTGSVKQIDGHGPAADGADSAVALSSVEADALALVEASNPRPLSDVMAAREAAVSRSLSTVTTPKLPGSGTVHEAVDTAVSFDAEAAEDADPVALAALLDAVADPAALVRSTHHRHGGTAMHLLCGGPGEDEDIVECLGLLVAAGADVNAQAGNGSSPLHWAAGTGQTAAIRALLSYGADPSRRSYTWRRTVFGRSSGQLAMHWAAESGHEDAVRVLAAASVESVVARDERGTLPVEVADKEGHTGVTQLLQASAAVEYVCVELSLEWEGQGML